MSNALGCVVYDIIQGAVREFCFPNKPAVINILRLSESLTSQQRYSDADCQTTFNIGFVVLNVCRVFKNILAVVLWGCLNYTLGQY